MLLHTNFYGEGEPILFLHSGAETSQTDYQDQRDEFSKKFRVIMPDLSGHGQSGIEDYNTIDEFFNLSVKDLHETLTHYNITQVHLVASSSSSLIAIQFCNLYPEFIKSLTMSGLTPIKTDDWDEFFKEDLDRKKIILKDPKIDAYFKGLHVKSDWKKFVSLVIHDNWYPYKLASDLSKLKKIPLFIISGEKVRPEVKGILYYVNNYKYVRVAIIPFAGHLVHREQPEIFNKFLELFIHDVNMQ